MTREIVVIGAGGHGRETIDIIEAINAVEPAFRLVGVVDDRGDEHGYLARRGIPVLGGLDVLADQNGSFVAAVGDPALRRALAEAATNAGLVSATLVHPTAVFGSDLHLGEGLVAAAQSQITTNVTTGVHVQLNIGATVSHDCVLGDYVTLSPGCHVSGNVHLGAGVTLGVGAVVRQGVSIGEGTFVGAGAVVVDDLPGRVTAIGVPARPLER